MKKTIENRILNLICGTLGAIAIYYFTKAGKIEVSLALMFWYLMVVKEEI